MVGGFVVVANKARQVAKKYKSLLEIDTTINLVFHINARIVNQVWIQNTK
ncbi:hypothetical protein [Campylobacter pinnipediorum]|nr:hypothetical protein [Campylobacter pinnipediorum]